jgi:glucosamine--fructose-6-phosphate aminotransferase (isomerizing)
MSGGVMHAEMLEQPAVLERLVGRFDDQVERLRTVVPDGLAGVAFLARGSSDHAAVYGRYLAELTSGRPAGLAAPSLHTLYRADVDYSGYLVVALSQSGATPEIVSVCARLRDAGARTVAITNAADSPLALAADVAVDLAAGAERAVPATKTVTAQLVALAMVGAALGPAPFTARDLAELPPAVAGVLDDPEPASAVAERFADTERLYVVARGLLYGAALEAALKIKETTGVFAEAISAADLRHGPIRAAGPDAPVLILDGGGPGSADLQDLASVLRERRVPVALCGPGEDADVTLPRATPEALAVVPATVRAQQLALAMADVRGLDADRPAGLTKVTRTH